MSSHRFPLGNSRSTNVPRGASVSTNANRQGRHTGLSRNSSRNSSSKRSANMSGGGAAGDQSRRRRNQENEDDSDEGDHPVLLLSQKARFRLPRHAKPEEVAARFGELVMDDKWSKSLMGLIGINLLSNCGLQIQAVPGSGTGASPSSPPTCGPPGSRTATSAAVHHAVFFAPLLRQYDSWGTARVIEESSIMKMVFMLYVEAGGTLDAAKFAERARKMFGPILSVAHRDTREVLANNFRACVRKAVYQAPEGEPLTSATILPAARQVFRNHSELVKKAMGEAALRRIVAPARHGMPISTLSPTDPPPMSVAECLNLAPTAVFELLLRPLLSLAYIQWQASLQVLVSTARSDLSLDDHELSDDDEDPASFEPARELLGVIDRWQKPPLGGGNKSSDAAFPRRLNELLPRLAVDGLGAMPSVSEVMTVTDAKRYFRRYLLHPHGADNDESEEEEEEEEEDNQQEGNGDADAADDDDIPYAYSDAEEEEEEEDDEDGDVRMDDSPQATRDLSDDGLDDSGEN